MRTAVRGSMAVKRRGSWRPRVRKARWPLAAVPAALVASAALFFLRGGAFAVREIEFEGCATVPADSIALVRECLKGRNLWLAPLGEMGERLRNNPEVAGVSFARRPCHRIECTIAKREPVALVAAGKLHEVDADGVVIPRRSGRGDIDLPIITGIADRDLARPGGAAALRRALAVLASLKELGFSPAEQLSEIHVERDEVTLVWMGTGTLVRLGREEYGGRIQKLRTIYGVFNEHERFPELIDLRFDRQVVIR